MMYHAIMKGGQIPSACIKLTGTNKRKQDQLPLMVPNAHRLTFMSLVWAFLRPFSSILYINRLFICVGQKLLRFAPKCSILIYASLAFDRRAII